MMGVIGIDADRRRLAIVSHVGAHKAWFTLERSDGVGVRWGYTLGLSNLMEQARGRAVVFLEDCYLPRRGNALRDVDTFRVLANVQGEILYEASRHGVEVRRVSPTEWQKRVLGFCKGREQIKAASRVEARKMLDCATLTEHESDAACLCLYGRWVLRNEQGAA